jgi:hypothetical protein
MDEKKGQLELGDDTETKRRSREIQILVNLLEPDPNLQPYFLSDKASVAQITLDGLDVIILRLESYFGKPLNVSLDQPLWKLVDQLKDMYPGWPDNWPPVPH